MKIKSSPRTSPGNLLKADFMPKLTVIICTFNEGRPVLDALRSLKTNEVYPDTEILLIDDCSTSRDAIRLLKLAERFTKAKVIRSRENMGLSHSRNLGFTHAASEFIVPLDGDDTLPAGVLDIIYHAFKEDPEAAFIAGNYHLKNIETGEMTKINCGQLATGGMVDRAKLARHWTLLGTSPCRRSTWAAVDGYAQKYSYSVQDMDFWIRVLDQGYKGIYIDHFIYTWNRSANGMNQNIDPLKVSALLLEHYTFYRQHFSGRYLANKIFGDFYPYKDVQLLISIGNRHFSG
jgi:glycosyltransferase involved in cell wall biosynthesis